MVGTNGTTATGVAEGQLLFTPSPERVSAARLTGYLEWLEAHRGLAFEDYDELWSWSVTDLDGFWSSVWAWAGIRASKEPTSVCERGVGAEGARFFVGAELNYVGQLLKSSDADLAVVTVDEEGNRDEVTYGQLRVLVGAAAHGLRRLGVDRGRPSRSRAAERAASDRRLPCHGEHRGDLVELRAGVRVREHGRPLQPDCAEGAARR